MLRFNCDWPKRSFAREQQGKASLDRFHFNFVKLFHCQLRCSLLRKGISNEAAAKGFNYAFSKKRCVCHVLQNTEKYEKPYKEQKKKKEEEGNA